MVNYLVKSKRARYSWARVLMVICRDLTTGGVLIYPRWTRRASKAFQLFPIAIFNSSHEPVCSSTETLMVRSSRILPVLVILKSRLDKQIVLFGKHKEQKRQ